MTRTAPNRRRLRWLLIAIGSFGLHTVWLFLPDWRQGHELNVHQVVPIKLSDLQWDVRSTIKLNHARSPASTVRERRTETGAGAVSRRPKNYGDLLPAALPGMVVSPSGRVWSSSSGGVLNVTESARSKPLIDDFAAELRAHLDVPLKIYHLRRRGSAHVTLTKNSARRWQIEVDGPDAYARAMILQALTSMTEANYGREQLERSDWTTIEIEFSFEWRNRFTSVVAASIQKIPLPETNVTGNLIQIAVVHIGSELELNKNLRRAWALAPLLVGVLNPIGIYEEFIKTPEDSGPKFDPVIRRLEQSSAFLRPLVTIPLGVANGK